MHTTLAAVHARSASVVTQQLAGTAADAGAALQQHNFSSQGYSGGAAYAEAEGQAGAAEYVDSISLRRAVNGRCVLCSEVHVEDVCSAWAVLRSLGAQGKEAHQCLQMGCAHVAIAIGHTLRS